MSASATTTRIPHPITSQSFIVMFFSRTRRSTSGVCNLLHAFIPHSLFAISCLFQFHVEAKRQNLFEWHCPCSSCRWEDDRRIQRGELSKHLAACATWWAGRVVQVCNGHCFDANTGAELAHRPHQGRALGANREAETYVFDVCAGDHSAVVQAKRRAHFESRVRRIGVLRRLCRLFHKIVERGLG